MKTPKSFWILLALLLPLQVWSGERIRLACIPSILTGLIPVAQHYGHFAEEDLEVVVDTYATGADALEALLAGKADLATMSEIPFLLASFKEPELRIIATIGAADSDNKLVVRKDRGIQSPRDLRGHKVAVQTKTASHYVLYLYLQKYGLEIADIQLVDLKVKEMPAALARGEIDAFIFREPVIGQARQLLGDRLAVLDDPGLYKKIMNLNTRRAFLESSLDLATRLLRALHKAEAAAFQLKPDIVAILAKATNLPASVVLEEAQDIRFRLTLTQELLLTLEHEAHWATAHGWHQGQAIPNFLGLVDTRAMKAAKPFGTSLR